MKYEVGIIGLAAIMLSSCKNEYSMRDDGSIINIVNRLDNHDISVFEDKVVIGGTTVIYCGAPDSFEYHNKMYYRKDRNYLLNK